MTWTRGKPYTYIGVCQENWSWYEQSGLHISNQVDDACFSWGIFFLHPTNLKYIIQFSFNSNIVLLYFFFLPSVFNFLLHYSVSSSYYDEFLLLACGSLLAALWRWFVTCIDFVFVVVGVAVATTVRRWTKMSGYMRALCLKKLIWMKTRERNLLWLKILIVLMPLILLRCFLPVRTYYKGLVLLHMILVLWLW